jgi:hypothetical protein
MLVSSREIVAAFASGYGSGPLRGWRCLLAGGQVSHNSEIGFKV